MHIPEMGEKIHQMVYTFLDNLTWIGNGKFSPVLREYSHLAANVLSSSPKISYLIKNNFFQLNLAQNDEEVGWRYLSADFRSFCDSLTRSLPKAFQKQALLWTSRSTSFAVNNLRNPWPITLIFFSDHWKFNIDSNNVKRDRTKHLLFFR